MSVAVDRRHAFWGGVSAVVLLFLAVFGFPMRNYFAQSSELDQARAELADLRARNVDLERRRAELQDPEQVEDLARRNHNLVFPGDESYVVLPPTEGGDVPGWVAKSWSFDPETGG